MRSRTLATWATGAALAAALLVVSPSKAQAQVGFGIQVGGYGAPAYGYVQSNPYDAWHYDHSIARERHEQWEAERAAEWRHQQWEQQRGYDRGFRHEDRRDGYYAGPRY